MGRHMRTRLASLFGATSLVFGIACGASAGKDGTLETDVSAAPARVVLQIDPNVPVTVRERITSLVRASAAGVPVESAPPDRDHFAPGDHVLAVGDVAAARLLVSDDEARTILPEGFILRSGERDGARLLVSRGTDAAQKAKYERPNRGTLYGAYAALEEIGFGFLHPLAPTVPARIALPSATVDRKESPHWHVRGLHLHTQHPIELANVLNGWGDHGPGDAAGFAATLPEWDRFLEWMVANRQNRVDWSLLEAGSWKDFSESAERQRRLGEAVAHAHAYGIDAGVDTPISQQQQHAFRLVTATGDPAAELASIRRRVGWLMKAGFDFLSTENGTTEFTHADPNRMLAWMNEVTRTMREDHDGRPATIKIHCSTGQTADGFTDPETGGPLNVNMLPHYADPGLGVMPHTVQHYGLDDPAPTYGNDSFDYMRKFLQAEVGRREVVWHPETAYWVSFDVDVPLFLPLYAERRVHDLRLLADDERAGRMGRGEHAGKRMDGQITFSSGWEWGYWLNDVVTARAAWNPHTEAPSDEAATRAILDEALRVFGDAKGPIVASILGWMKDERELLIYGRVDGKSPQSLISRNAQAYLQGWETFDDIALLARKIPGQPIPLHPTQPDHLGLVEMRNPIHGGPGYSREVAPMLTATEAILSRRARELEAASAAVPEGSAKELARELSDAGRITALRAIQVHGLYDYVDLYFASLNPFSSAADRERAERLRVARSALDQAARIVAERERHYRVPVARIASWGNNPTAYEFGYLWTVHSLFFWWRDEGKAVDAPLSPCYQNIINPADVAAGEGSLVDGLRLVRKVFDGVPGLGSITDCVAEARHEPTFPQDGLRSRP
jgi:hypothetical protein